VSDKYSDTNVETV